MIDDCTALILAGGDSRRMGQDKAALVLDGKTLLAHVTATMQQVFPKVVVSVRQLRDEVDVPQVRDEVAASGPLAGLIAGLAQADTPWVFAVACDMPFVTVKVVERLAEFRSQPTPAIPFQDESGLVFPEKVKSGVIQAVVPMVDGYPQPLAAFYARAALDEMRASLASGDRSLRGMLQRLDVCYVNKAELRECDPQMRSFFDLDTPQDYLAAQK
ncbi:MAG: molybdenum cofactor guanylyltransferase [Gallionella sp.]|nr:molybdenum cofactor guanylyltransferase [Gallionella sp.]